MCLCCEYVWCVCVICVVSMCVCACAVPKKTRGVGSSGARVTSGCELLDTGAGN